MRHRGRSGATVLAALVGLCALTGCSNSHATDSSSTTSSISTTTTTTTSSTAPTSSARLAVLAAYRAGWAAFEHALADANPEDPALPATMVDQVKANMLADQQHGMVGRGTTTLHPKITALSATSATVVDCAYSTAELVYQATGKPVPPVTPPENDGVTSTLVLTGGTWKVSKQIVTDGKCTPGS